MRKIQLLPLILFVITTTELTGQVPQSFKFQAVLRDPSGELKVNKKATMQISIIAGGINGFAVYSENHSVITSDFGVINLVIGKGADSNANLSDIDWAAGPYFVKISVDGVDFGTSQLLSVPYAQYAARAGNGFSGNFSDLSGTPEFSAVAVSGDFEDLANKPELAAVASTGEFSDLVSKPVIATIDDASIGPDKLWSSAKVADSISSKWNVVEARSKFDALNWQIVALELALLNSLGHILYTDKKGKLVDIDGNIYKIVKIGNRWWMAENLKVTHLNDGTPLLFTSDSLIWNKGMDRDRNLLYTYYQNDINKSNGVWESISMVFSSQ
ncbi:MAG: hypothetical protein WD824_16610 [Cyclobacteriaceae bacterium]